MFLTVPMLLGWFALQYGLVAIAHAEFESIHPFLDGNGRLGRMIVPLMMWKDGLMARPSFYLSAFFDKNNDAYQDKLLSVSRINDWTNWCLFFLEAVTEQANENLQKAKKIHSLREELTNALLDLSGSKYSAAVVDKLFNSAIFSLSEFVQMKGVDPQTARRLVGILEKITISSNCILEVGADRKYLFFQRSWIS